jgi:hypothetical protein
MTEINVGRRRLMGYTGAAALAGAMGPLLGAGTGHAGAAAPEPGSTPDALVVEGRFAEADCDYAEILRKDPKNAHAAGRRGEIALLSNRFAAAEKFLTAAVGLAPAEKQYKTLLGDCYVRQDQYARGRAAVPGVYRFRTVCLGM